MRPGPKKILPPVEQSLFLELDCCPKLLGVRVGMSLFICWIGPLSENDGVFDERLEQVGFP